MITPKYYSTVIIFYSNNNIGAEGAKGLGEGFSKMTNLTTMTLKLMQFNMSILIIPG